MKHVSVHPWTDEELREVVETGAKELLYDMPNEVTERIVKNSSNSIAALQLLCIKYYASLRKNHGNFDHSEIPTMINNISQLLSSDLVDKYANDLVEIGKWGAEDATGRPTISFVIEAMIFLPPTELRAGLTIGELSKAVAKLSSTVGRRRNGTQPARNPRKRVSA